MSARNRRSLLFFVSTTALLLCASFTLGHAIAQTAAVPDANGAAPSPSSPASAMPAAAVPLPSSQVSAATAAEIQKINESMTLLQAELNRLELQAKIASKKKEIGAAGAGPDATQSSFDSKAGNPSVVSVSGLKGDLEATLVFPGGVTQRVREGDLIDERRVTKVARNEVVLTDLKGRNVQRLAFGSTPVTREKTTLQPANSPSVPPGYPTPLPPGAAR